MLPLVKSYYLKEAIQYSQKVKSGKCFTNLVGILKIIFISDVFIFPCFPGLEVDDTSIDAEGATISWNDYTDLEQSDFNQYLIKLKKRNTEEDVETFKVSPCLY